MPPWKRDVPAHEWAAQPGNGPWSQGNRDEQRADVHPAATVDAVVATRAWGQVRD